ncbi:MAG TPA: lysylphosphatidylglycerol synthase transmembrane domain-containing protein [Gaiellales bacterium]|nr:lysylphosphatidylglycerol synthase transmembrane domain-containing protein [Gaiellales bacterium]
MPVHIAPAGIRPAGHRLGMPLVRLAGALAVLALLWQRVGAAPFQDGLQAVTLPALAAAVVSTALATVCAAWRWRVIARTLGVGMPMMTAIGAYYRSQFLNSVLPGVPGDVHRAVAHGRRAGALGRGVRAATWDRLSGQVVQAVLTGLALLLLPSPARPFLPVIVAGGVALAVFAVLVVWIAGRRAGSRPAGVARAVSGDVRHRLLARRVWPQLALASTVIVAGHTGTFVIAARVAGAGLPLGELVALALLVQTAMVIPLSVGGWGVREGAAAWAFGAAGVGAAAGITVTTVFGILTLAAMAPGAALLLADSTRREPPRRGEVVDG